jgi:hypothetical protein
MAEPLTETLDRRTALGHSPRRLRRLFSAPHLRTVVGAVIGAGAAGAYAWFVGCETGTCPLTSNVWTATLYGGVVGAVAGWPARTKAKER